MHEIAENGVAAHWFYKQPDSSHAHQDLHKFRWVQDLLEILENSAAPDEFLENTKLELYGDQVFCFTPKGQLIQLPRGATPVDFAYAVHSQVGDTCVGAKVNGRLMPLRHQLQNGDQVEIMTARGGTPSPQWERFVVTGKARARIRRFIHQEQRQQNLDAGRGRADQGVPSGRGGRIGEGAGTGAEGAEVRRPPTISHIAVGNGNLGAARCGSCRLSGTAASTARAADDADAAAARRAPPARFDIDMPVTGLVPGMAYHFAGCCHPVPGDEIVGIVTTGKGVTIHGRDCQTLDGFAATPERFIDVDWNYEAVGKGEARSAGHTARISVIAENEPAAWRTSRTRVAKQDGAIANLKIVNRQQDFMEVLVDVDVRDVAILPKVIAGLRGAEAYQRRRAGERR